MAFTTQLNLIDSKFCQSSGTLTLSGDTRIASVGTIQYLTDQSTSYVARSVVDAAYVTGQTADLQAQITQNADDIQLVSGVTTTNTANIAQNVTDIGLVSAVTTTNTDNIAQNVTDIGLVSAVTTTNTADIATITGLAITGATNGLTKTVDQDVELGGTLSKLTSIILSGNQFGICDGNSKYIQHAGGISLYGQNVGNCGGVIGVSSSLTQVTYYSGLTTSTELRIEDTTGMLFQDEIWSRGIDYSACYHANYTDRTLVDKEYVDLCAGGSGVQSANNGLTKSGTNVHLGGTLTGSTTINLGSHDLKFGGDSVQYVADYSTTFVARSLVDKGYVTGLTSGLQTSIDENAADIVYLSGQTDLKLAINDFNTYSGLTDTRITNIEEDVTFLGVFSGDTVADLAYISGQTDTNETDIATITGLAITGATSGLTKSGQNAVLGGTLGGATDIDINGKSLTITDAGGAGIEYAADYSGTFVNESLVTKRYVDSAAGGISATNGLSREGDNIVLGGTLTGDTTVVLGAKSLSLTDTHLDVCFGDENFHIDYDDAAGSCSFIYGGTSGLGGIVTLCASDAIYLYYDSQLVLNNNGGSNTIWATYNTFFTPSSVASKDIPNAGYVTGLTANLQSQIDENAADIVYLSGQTDLKLNISDFNTYSGDTDTRITNIEDDVTFLSVFSGDTVADLAYISAQTSTNTDDIATITGLAITGASNGLTKSGQDAILGGALTGDTNICINSGDLTFCGSANQSYQFGYLGMNLNFNGSCIYLTNSGNDFKLVSRLGSCVDINASGLTYGGDYSSNFNPHTLVDKAYVDASTGGIGADNGLTKCGANIVLGGNLTGDTTINLGSHDLKFGNDSVQYVANYSGTYVARSLVDAGYVTGLTNGLQTSIDENAADIVYLSGQTDLKLAITDFNSYTGTTDTRLDGIEEDITFLGVFSGDTVADLAFISGATDDNTADITFLGVFSGDTVADLAYISGATDDNTADITFLGVFSGDTVADLAYVSAQTDTNTTDIATITGLAITGASNGLCKYDTHNVCLGGLLTNNVIIDGNQSQSFQVCDVTLAKLLVDNGVNTSSISVAPTTVSMLIETGVTAIQIQRGTFPNQQLIELGSSGIQITDNIDNAGVCYSGDYESNFVPRSLVTKQYVDSATGGIGATSGLHRDGANIVLGGALTGNTDISGTDTLTISAPSIASDVQYNVFDSTPVQIGHTEGRLYYSGCALNFDREVAGVTLQIGEESVIRVTNQTGNPITNGTAVYIPGALGGIPTVAKSSASNFTGARFVGLLTQDIADNGEGYITTDGTVHNLDTSAWTVGDAIWVSTTAGELTNVRPTYPDSSTLVGIVTVDHSDDGEILVRSNNIPDHVEISTFTGYTASTQTELDLKLYITDFNAYSGVTDTRLDDIEEVTDIALTGATNGLCVTGRDVYLGGALTEATTISGAFNLTLASTCDTQIRTVANSINVDAQSNGLLALKSQSGTLTGPTSFSSAIGFSLDFDQSSGFIVYDNRTGSDQEGIRYASNYSTNFVDRSLVDKAYVDSVASGRATKESVLVATTGHSGLSGLTATVDGVTLSDTDRVLVKNQNDAQYNGIYSASTGVWGRTDDYDFTPAGEIANGDLIPVISGETNANTQWVLTTPDPVEVNDDLNFSLFSKLLQISGGDGIDITQSSGTDVISVDLANNSGLEFNSNALSVANEIAGSGLTWTAGVINVNACPNEATGTCIPVLFDAACNLVVDSDDFSYTTAENGLSKQGCNVVLGGALTGDTTVCGDSNVYDLSFTELDVLTLSSACGTVTTTDTFGLQYSTDYKSSFCDNSLVSKAYVDCQVTGGVLADNGLTKVVDTVIWGGALTGDTFVSLGTGRICMLDTSVVTVCSDCSYLNVSATSIDSYTCNDNSCVSQVDLNDDGTLSIVANNALTGLTITAAAVGAVYAGDYESNFVGRSLVTKTYVDTCAANELVGAENGLTKLGDNNIVLGGALTGDTTITGANYNLHLGTLGSALAELNLAATSVKLIATPATGAVTDAVLVWNSTDKIIKQIDATNLGEDNNRYSVTAITNSTINLTGTEFVVLVDANSNSVTVNLPATPTTGMAFKIKDTGGDALTNNITVVPNAGNIDGSSNAIINTNYGAMEIVYGGSEWKILSFVN